MPHDHSVRIYCGRYIDAGEANPRVLLPRLGETLLRALRWLAQVACHPGLTEALPLHWCQGKRKALIVDVRFDFASPESSGLLGPLGADDKSFLGIFRGDTDLLSRLAVVNLILAESLLHHAETRAATQAG